MSSERLRRQLEFIAEIDKLKTIYRQTVLIADPERRENDAEHSWHLALMAMLLAEHANETVDLPRVMKMVLIHDIVEIDAGDTFCYDEAGNLDKEEREQKAATRLFGLLPEDQGREFWQLWEEFEERRTPEARFAAALDRLQPMLHNFHTDGGTWRRHNITREQVLKRNQPMAQGAVALWDYAEAMLDVAIEQGLLPAEKQSKGES
ncbi:MAG: HD domain-containing protein [Firmicutes bacterium]|nr:HD domain-containing protein [Bacillota bacterium]